MSIFTIDVEANGRIPGKHSMTEFGIVKVDKEGLFNKTFHGKLAPMFDDYIPDCLAISGKTFEETKGWGDPKEVMKEAAAWVLENNTDHRPKFYSDNNGYDFMWWHWYCMWFLEEDPFGHSSNNIKNIYNGLIKDTFKNHKKLRKTRHSHHPVDDAKGNAEALYYMYTNMKLGINLK